MAGSTSATRQWLMQQPRPHTLRVHVNGEPAPRDLSLQPGQSWQKLADTIDALAPRLVEALSETGRLIRARNPELVTPDDVDQVETGDPDDPTVPVEGDTQIETFARLLADAHRISGERAMTFVETAFAKIVEIANVQSSRLDKMQALVDAMQRRWMRDASNTIDGVNDGEGGDASQQALLAQMFASFVQGQAMSGAKANGTNGAPHGAGGK